MASLDGAVALAENADSAAVPEELCLDVPWALEVSLTEDRAVAERALGLASGGRESLLELGGATDDAHAATAAAGGGLDDEREADLLRRSLGQRWHACLTRDPLGSELVATEPKRLRRRTDPRDAGGDDLLGERGALGEEAVAGVDRIGSGLAGGPHVLRSVEIRRDLQRPSGRPCVERTAVVWRHDRDGLDAEPRARAEDAERDLSTVGDEERADRHGQTLCGVRPLPGRDERHGDERAHDADVLRA